MLLHPLRKKRRFPGPLFVPKITRDEFPADGQSGVGGKDHVGQLRLRRDEMDVAPEAKEFLVQSAPLRLDERGIGAAGAAHPGIDFVFDAVVIGRAKQKIAHTGCCLTIFLDEIGQLTQERLDVGDQTDGLEASAIGQLRDYPGIDIDAEFFHRRRQQIPDRD